MADTLNPWRALNVILDDGDLITPQVEQRGDFLEILDDRYQKRSSVVTTQLPIAPWQEH